MNVCHSETHNPHTATVSANANLPTTEAGLTSIPDPRTAQDMSIDWKLLRIPPFQESIEPRVLHSMDFELRSTLSVANGQRKTSSP